MAMEPRAKLWLEHAGRLVLSEYRAHLLRRIGETGSLARAAEEMHLSYRRAWGKVRELEQNFGRLLVQSDVGGHGGGKSQLTEDGKRLLAQFDAFKHDLNSTIATLGAEHFAGWTNLPSNANPDPSRQVGEQIESIADDPVDAPLE